MSKPVASKRAKIDFAKYRSDELLNAVLDLVDIRGIYVNAIVKILLGALLLGAIGGLAFWFRVQTIWVWIPVVAFCVFAGGFAGGIFGIAEVIRKSLDNMLQVVGLMLEVTKTIARDVASVSDGETEMPTARELVNGVYTEVMLPMVEQAVAEKLGCLGTPVLFLYRLTLGRVMKFVIKVMPDRAVEMLEDGNSVEDTGGQIMSRLKGIAAYEDRITSVLEWTQEKVKGLGGGFRNFVMLPCYILVAGVFLAVMIVLTLLWFLVGNIGAEPEVVSSVASLGWLLQERRSDFV